MGRRSAFFDDELEPTENSQSSDSNGFGFGNDAPAPGIQPERPASILDQLRVATPKKKVVRDRSWEEGNPTKTYRKVHSDIRDAINDIAIDYNYNASQIAQAFLEYALMCYRRADFALELELDSRHGLTLMPGGWSDEKKPIWAENAWGKQPPQKKKRKKKDETPLYKMFVGYRLTPHIVAEIDAVCETRRFPDGNIISRKYHDGEVVARFLTFAIEAYNSGKLALRDAENE
ncbi:MAG: hypothetical protein HN413_01045 [Chloroflexi bacterium]|jgi:hypothetical protein|nr:hypothetical protein [Chloroflexota bacterium]